jgi:hypothetical protein
MPALIHGTLICDTCDKAISCTGELTAFWDSPRIHWHYLPEPWRVHMSTTKGGPAIVYCSSECDKRSFHNHVQYGKAGEANRPVVDPRIMDRIVALTNTDSAIPSLPSADEVLDAIAAVLKAIGK